MTIKPYTKQELALLYFPNANVGNAMRTLKNWININADLQRELHATYYNKWAKNHRPSSFSTNSLKPP